MTKSSYLFSKNFPRENNFKDAEYFVIYSCGTENVACLWKHMEFISINTWENVVTIHLLKFINKDDWFLLPWEKEYLLLMFSSENKTRDELMSIWNGKVQFHKE